MNAHTQGPWIVIFDEDIVSRPFATLEAAQEHVRMADEETAGNVHGRIVSLSQARAAPDLLEALRATLAVDCTVKGKSDPAWDRVHAAIAKAEAA